MIVAVFVFIMANKIKSETKLKVFEKYDCKCAYCGVEITIDKMHIDHINPKYRGWNQSELDRYGLVKGRDTLDNYNPSCASCNISKSTFTIEKWREQIKLKVERIRKESTNFRLLERFNIIEVKDIDVKFYFEEREVCNG